MRQRPQSELQRKLREAEDQLKEVQRRIADVDSRLKQASALETAAIEARVRESNRHTFGIVLVVSASFLLKKFAQDEQGDSMTYFWAGAALLAGYFLMKGTASVAPLIRKLTSEHQQLLSEETHITAQISALVTSGAVASSGTTLAMPPLARRGFAGFAAGQNSASGSLPLGTPGNEKSSSQVYRG